MRKIDRNAYLFIAPFFIVFATFVIYPIISSFYTSLTVEDEWTSDAMFVGFSNYARELTTPAFWQSFLNTWAIWLPNIIMQIILAFLIAVVMTDLRLRIKAVGLFRAVFFFPNLVTYASIAILAYAILDWQTGTLNQLLFGVGEAASENYVWWLNDPRSTQFILSIIQTWIWFGYTAIILMAGIQGIPNSYFEAAMVDGANRWRMFWSVTIPMLRPILIYVVITSLIGGMQIFDMPYVLFNGQGGPEQSASTMMVYMYRRAFAWNDAGGGASVSYIMFVITAIFSWINFKIMKRDGGGIH